MTKAVRGTEDALEDAESAGKQMAKAIEASADSMIDEIEKTKRAVDALESALDDTDLDSRSVVADLKRVGLTAEDIEQDANELAAALKRAGDVKLKAESLGFTDVDQALGRTTDNSRIASTAIGGIGNSISELPGIGSLGPVAESMGMLAENALEGEAGLRGLVGAGLGLAALGITMNIISGEMGKMKRTTELLEARQEDYNDVWQETNDLTEGVNRNIEEQRKIIATYSGEDNDVTEVFQRNGLAVEDFTAAVLMSREEQDAWGLALMEAGVSGEDLGLILTAVRQETDAATTSLQASQAANAVFGDVAEETTEDIDDQTDATERAKEALDKQREALELLRDATYESRDSSLAYRNQVARTSKAIWDSALVMQDAKSSEEDIAQAHRDTEAAVYAQADAKVRLAEDTMESQGATLSAEAADRIYRAELDRLAANLNGPAKAAIDAHTERLNKVPKTINTRVTLTGTPSNRDPSLPYQTGAGTRFGATGGIVTRPTLAVIGESGAEAVVPLRNTGPLNQAPGASPLTAGSGARTVNIYQNFPAGTTPAAVKNATRVYERVQGPT